MVGKDMDGTFRAPKLFYLSDSPSQVIDGDSLVILTLVHYWRKEFGAEESLVHVTNSISVLYRSTFIPNVTTFIYLKIKHRRSLLVDFFLNLWVR
jgi:hypothetical protein